MKILLIGLTAMLVPFLPSACSRQVLAQEPATTLGPGGNWGYGHAENHEWYKDLRQPSTGYSCCNGDTTHGDCRPTRAYLDEDGRWRALVEGKWREIPPTVVLRQLAPDGGSHVCAGKGPDPTIYCFIGGVPKS